MPRASFALLLVVMASLAHDAGAATAPRSIGLIVDASPTTHPVAFMRFADVLVEALAASRQWEPTVLHPDSPIVRVSGATWPLPTRDNWMTVADALQTLLLTTELDDLVVLRPIPAATNDLEVFWLRQGEKEIRRLHLSEPGAGDQAYAALSRKLLAQLDQGTQSAPLAERFALVPPSTPATPAAPPATAPTAPASPATPATGAAVGVGGHETPTTAVAPVPPATPATPATGLTKPGATEARPGGQAVKPDVPTAQPATEPVGPQAPATPATPTTPAAPTGPTATPATTLPAAAPAKPGEPSTFLAAAQKLIREGDLRRAEDLLVKAQDAGDPRAQVFALWAELEQARQNPTAERAWLQRALAEDDSLTSAHLRLAELLRQAGLWRKAADEYQTVIKQDPANVYGYVGLSALYARQSQPRRAAEILTEALKHVPPDPSLYLRIGALHAQRQAWAEAENAYDRAVRLTQGTQRAEALDQLGDLYLQAGRDREGFICYAEASKLRAGGSSTMAEKRYDQIMRAADAALLDTSTRAQAALEAYLAGRSVYREEVWAAFNDFRTQVQEMSGFIASVVPPATARGAHLERKLAYSLAAEAALAGLDYIDQGASKRQRLDDYRRLVGEALTTIRGLQHPA